MDVFGVWRSLDGSLLQTQSCSRYYEVFAIIRSYKIVGSTQQCVFTDKRMSIGVCITDQSTN